MNWFQCKISYEKIVANGTQLKVNEQYLVDALSYTEAEARIIEEMKTYISGEFTVADIKRANYAELFDSNDSAADRWWECKVEFITLDEKSGAEKRSGVRMLVFATDLQDALNTLNAGMTGTMADYWVKSIKETAIMDIFPYEAEKTPTSNENN
jgi:chlorite dismutase